MRTAKFYVLREDEMKQEYEKQKPTRLTDNQTNRMQPIRGAEHYINWQTDSENQSNLHRSQKMHATSTTVNTHEQDVKDQLRRNFIAHGLNMVKTYNLPMDATYQFSHIAQEHGAIAAATICPESICYFGSPEKACKFLIAVQGLEMNGNTLRAEGHHVEKIEDFRSLMEHFQVKNNVPMFRLQ